MKKLVPRDITIAITVYDRKDYLRLAIRSALSQTSAERPAVVVVEDCGPDPEMQSAILSEFAGQIEYLRNPTRRGLFDNWNACIAACRTPWLCILHDDDSLHSTFVESMIELAEAAPSRALYYGRCDIMDASGRFVRKEPPPESFAWHELPLEAWTRYDPVCFPGQMFNVAAARALGGFRGTSRYCADWELWFRLTLHQGSVATNRVVASYREHHSVGRGTTNVDVSGRKYAYGNVQRKRHIAWLRPRMPNLRFDRKALLQGSAMSTRFILQHGYGLSPRMLRYNAGLLYLSSAPHLGYRLFQALGKVVTWRGLRLASRLFQWSSSRLTRISKRETATTSFASQT